MGTLMASEQIWLFENNARDLEPESAALTLVSRRNQPLTRAQLTFNRLVARIETLRLKLERETRRLDDALAYYGEHLHPRLRRQTELRKGLVRAFAAFLDDKGMKAKSARSTLRQVIAKQLQEILFQEGSLSDDDLRALFERVHGRGFEEFERDEFEDARQQIETVFSDLDIGIDLSDIKPGMSAETLAAKAAEMADRFWQNAEETRQSSSPQRRKTQRQMEKEERQRLAAELCKKTVATIYKQLARVLHPDLELDAARRGQKEVLMQELTVAYRNNDMHTLLRLEMEWIQREEDNIERLTDEKLAIYNQTLKEQVENLERELYELPYHPRYQPIAVPDGPFGATIRTDGPAEARALDAVNASMEASIRDLQSRNGLETLKAILRSYREEQRAVKRDLRDFPF
jgi:exonuclease VII small subunit